MASKSHSLSGNCADLPIAPPKSNTATGTSKLSADMLTAHVVSASSSLKPNVPANAKIINMPASIMTSPTLVMMNAFIPECVGE